MARMPVSGSTHSEQAAKGAAAAYMEQPAYPPQPINRIRLTKTVEHVLVLSGTAVRLAGHSAVGNPPRHS